jgi:hypothetical protein
MAKIVGEAGEIVPEFPLRVPKNWSAAAKVRTYIERSKEVDSI